MGHNLRPFRAADVEALKSFKCSVPGEKYTQAVQRMVRRELPVALAADDADVGALRALVAENDDGSLVGIIVWGPVEDDPEQWFVHVLAVDRKHWRQGYGTALKLEVMSRVPLDGGEYVVSKVHRRNFRMLRLNKKLSVLDTKDPEDGDYRLSGIYVKPRVATRVRRAIRRS